MKTGLAAIKVHTILGSWLVALADGAWPYPGDRLEQGAARSAVLAALDSLPCSKDMQAWTQVSGFAAAVQSASNENVSAARSLQAYCPACAILAGQLC